MYTRAASGILCRTNAFLKVGSKQRLSFIGVVCNHKDILQFCDGICISQSIQMLWAILRRRVTSLETGKPPLQDALLITWTISTQVGSSSIPTAIFFAEKCRTQGFNGKITWFRKHLSFSCKIYRAPCDGVSHTSHIGHAWEHSAPLNIQASKSNIT